MSDPIVDFIDLEPGGILVVGPRGRLHIHYHASGDVCVSMVNCDVIGTDHMSEAHKALVDERWRDRSETGDVVVDTDPDVQVSKEMKDIIFKPSRER